jgi:phosphoribosyl-ATP pyrophosphohydrolase
MNRAAVTLRFACGLARRSLNWQLIYCCHEFDCWEGNPNMSTPRRPIDELEQTIAQRADSSSEKSYTSQLLAGGVAKIGPKVSEEATEVVEAANEPGDVGREHFIREVGDLLYHLMVLMRYKNCSLADVESELARRFGVSGLDEKASRKKDQ